MLSSCVTEPSSSSIPYAWVSFEIDVSTGGVHSSLRRDMLGNMLIFSVSNPSILSSSSNAGYGFGGVIVVRGMDNELYAFTRFNKLLLFVIFFFLHHKINFFPLTVKISLPVFKLIKNSRG